MAVVLLEAGLAKLQTSFGADRIPDFHLLAKAEQSAKQQKLKVSYVVLALKRFETIDYLYLLNNHICLLILVRYGKTMLKDKKLPMAQQLKARKKFLRC